ncbi:hypothetical protein [Nocardioides speluncae]|uniref:hypothetical protein n=1 Tax=Nocardioides speluncae TaxID=2670337 RepID=UPI000D698695|nr:hypothetical protein [Nocardioides speluncae]
MTLTFGEVQTWRSAPLGKAGESVKKDADALEESRDGLEKQGIPDSWQGLSRFFAVARRNALVGQMTTHVEGKRKLQRALIAAETDVIEIERLVKDVVDTARTQEFGIAADGSVTDGATPPEFNNRWEAEEYGRGRSGQAQAIADDISTILANAAVVDATIANGIPAGHVSEIDERGTVSPEVAKRWSELSDDERKAIIEQQIEELAEAYGIDNPTIIWEQLSGNGSWSEENGGEVRLNIDNIDDPDILHTVAHEMQHARQHEAVRDNNDWQFPWEDDPFDMHEDDGITEDQADAWEDNFDNYQDSDGPDDPEIPGDAYEEYYEQPVESNARDEGREYVDGLTEDELDRLLEESQE